MDVFDLTLPAKANNTMSIANKLRLQDDKTLYLLQGPAKTEELFAGFAFKDIIGGKQPIGQVLLFAKN